MIDPQLDSRVAMVTGANTGIGAAIAIALAQQGVRLFLTFKRMSAVEDADTPPEYDRNLARDASWVVDEITAKGGQAVAREADLASHASIPWLFAEADNAYGQVDLLVNNAAFGQRDSFLLPGRDHRGLHHEPLTGASFDAHLAVNGRAAAILIAEYARHHTARNANWGRIIGITSSGRDGFREKYLTGKLGRVRERDLQRCLRAR